METSQSFRKLVLSFLVVNVCAQSLMKFHFPSFKKEKKKKVDIPPLRKTQGKKNKKTREIVTTKEEDEETESSLSLVCAPLSHVPRHLFLASYR